MLGATAPSFLKGLGYDRELIEKIEAATGRTATYQAEAATVDRLNARHVRVLGRVARLARGGDISSASREARALRVFAGDANSRLLRLGLTACLLRPSSIPL